MMTQQRATSYYIGWFMRTHRSSETGWHSYQTPDGLAIMLQDAFFWQCLEVVCRMMNQLIAEEQNRKK
jgi:hypothetical protein